MAKHKWTANIQDRAGVNQSYPSLVWHAPGIYRVWDPSPYICQPLPPPPQKYAAAGTPRVPWPIPSPMWFALHFNQRKDGASVVITEARFMGSVKCGTNGRLRISLHDQSGAEGGTLEIGEDNPADHSFLRLQGGGGELYIGDGECLAAHFAPTGDVSASGVAIAMRFRVHKGDEHRAARQGDARQFHQTIVLG